MLSLTEILVCVLVVFGARLVTKVRSVHISFKGNDDDEENG